MTVFWHKILASIDNKNVNIQSKGKSLDVETALMRLSSRDAALT
jgi:hypothetical protein